MKLFKDKISNQMINKHPKMDRAYLPKMIDDVFDANKDVINKCFSNGKCNFIEDSNDYNSLYYYFFDQVKVNYQTFIIYHYEIPSSFLSNFIKQDEVNEEIDFGVIEKKERHFIKRNPFFVANELPNLSYVLFKSEFNLPYFERTACILWLKKKLDIKLDNKTYPKEVKEKLSKLMNKILAEQQNSFNHIKSIFSEIGILKFQRRAAIRIRIELMENLITSS